MGRRVRQTPSGPVDPLGLSGDPTMILADAPAPVNADDDTDLFVVEEIAEPTGVFSEPTGPDPDDSRWWADQNGSEPDWDSLADDSAATDAHERGLIFA